MLRRLLQVIHALTSKMESQDHGLVAANLDSRERPLFYSMDINSQKHSVKVAQTCLKLASSHPSVNVKLLVKAALLHDIGKEQGDLTTFYRIIFVITDKLSPTLAKSIAKTGIYFAWRKLGHAFLILYNHPDIGSQKAKNAGVDRRIMKLIALHHTPYVSGETPELTLLRKADSLN